MMHDIILTEMSRYSPQTTLNARVLRRKCFYSLHITPSNKIFKEIIPSMWYQFFFLLLWILWMGTWWHCALYNVYLPSRALLLYLPYKHVHMQTHTCIQIHPLMIYSFWIISQSHCEPVVCVQTTTGMTFKLRIHFKFSFLSIFFFSILIYRYILCVLCVDVCISRAFPYELRC